MKPIPDELRAQMHALREPMTLLDLALVSVLIACTLGPWVPAVLRWLA